MKFRPGTAASQIGKAHRQAGGHSLSVIPGISVHVIQVPGGTVLNKLAAYRRNPNVVFAEPDWHRILIFPNEGSDPPPPDGSGADYFDEQWGLHNTGQPLTDPNTGQHSLSGSPDADIDAPAGWDISTGSPSVKVAVLDTGIDCPSVELAGKCVEQVNFVSAYSGTTEDLVSHGTHVAGTIAAHTNNGIGVAGVGWQTSVGNLKACYEYTYDLFPPFGLYITVGVCPVSASAAAITYAADNGYHVINMSYASDEVDAEGNPTDTAAPPNAETAAVTYAWNQGVVLVAAAGNAGDTVVGYPAGYSEVIAVGATDRYDNLASFSSFGNGWVSVLAPGENILSTIPDASCEFLVPGYTPGVDDCLAWYSGTSMASPHAAAVAALVWAHVFPGQSPQTCVAGDGSACNSVVRSHVENRADKSGALGQNFLAWSQHGRLNLHQTLADGDGDGILSPIDNCPDVDSIDQTDTDADGQGDVCDSDDDNDGLSDVIEQNIGTNPLLADSDGDSVSDYAEVNVDGDPGSYTPGLDLNPLDPDSDGDGLNDGIDPLPLAFHYQDGDLAPLGAPDGLINAADLLICTRIATGSLVASELELVHGDLHPPGAPDGIIDVSDLLLLRSMVLP